MELSLNINSHKSNWVVRAAGWFCVGCRMSVIIESDGNRERTQHRRRLCNNRRKRSADVYDNEIYGIWCWANSINVCALCVCVYVYAQRLVCHRSGIENKRKSIWTNIATSVEMCVGRRQWMISHVSSTTIGRCWSVGDDNKFWWFIMGCSRWFYSIVELARLKMIFNFL